ncbi:MAG: methyltransferase family protein [Terriglobales bacterium]
MHRESLAAWQRIARRIRVPTGFAFVVLYLWLAHPTRKSILAGSAFVIICLLVRAVSSGHLNKNQKLATGGPYAYSRNPLYLGSLILALGFAMAALSGGVAVLLAVIFAAIYMPVIQAEEAFLRTTFPEFADYTREVPRLIPRLPSHRSGGGFSWGLYMKHREYNAALGSAALIAALIAKLLWNLHKASPAIGFNFWH